MGIEVIAIAPNDGWAFIKKEDSRIFLLRPPYTSSDQIEASEKDLENAIHLHGFEECAHSFSNIKEVIRFLKDKYVEAMKNLGVELPSLDDLKELLKYASDDILLEFLEKAERDLIPRGKLDVAISIALDIMKLEKARANPKICSMAVAILEECNQKKREKEELSETLMEENQRKTWGERFPNAVDKYSEEYINHCKESVRTRRQLLPVGNAKGNEIK